MTGGPAPAARRWRAWWPAAAWAALILALTSVPHPSSPLPSFVGLDKLVHAGMYGVLGLLAAVSAARDVRLRGRPALHVALAVAAAVAALGALDELHQALIPGRSAELLDWTADLVGGTLGALAGLPRLRRRPAAGAGERTKE